MRCLEMPTAVGLNCRLRMAQRHLLTSAVSSVEEGQRGGYSAYGGFNITGSP